MVVNGPRACLNSPKNERGGPKAAPRLSASARISVRHRVFRVRRVRRILGDTADEIERGMKRLVILRIRRDVGLRAGLLVAFRLEMPTERGLTAGVGTGL